jgi:hypothetical protein
MTSLQDPVSFITVRTKMNLLSACALGMGLLSLVLAEARTAETGSRSFRGAALPHASLSTPVKASNPDASEPSKEDVLSVYPSKFIVDWDDLPMTPVAALMYQSCGTVATTTCEIGEDLITCWCTESVLSAFDFGCLEIIGQQNLNTPIQASGSDPYAFPTFDDALDIYHGTFLVDWSVGHDGTEAAGILFDACGMDATICMVEETRLECLCKDLASPIYLAYDMVRAALPHASLNMHVYASDPDVGPSTGEVLSVYPEIFTVDWDEIPMTAIAAQVYRACGVVDRSTCRVRETDFICYCTTKSMGSGFGGLQNIPEQDLNTPIRASGPDADAVPKAHDVAKVYPHWSFLVDWKSGHDGTMAAESLFEACGMVPTSCFALETSLECLCKDIASPVFLGYELLRPPNVLPNKLAAVVPVWYNDWK